MTLTYNVSKPVGQVLVYLPEMGIIKWVDYITNRVYNDVAKYESDIFKCDEGITVIINDTKSPDKRCSIRNYDYYDFFQEN